MNRWDKAGLVAMFIFSALVIASKAQAYIDLFWWARRH